MTEEELIAVCSDKSLQNFKRKAPYWVCEVYGFGRHIRRYGYYPKNLPLIIFTEHSGPVVRLSFNYYETNHDSPVVFLHSPDRVKEWQARYKKPCYSLYSPFVFYRRKNNIIQSKDAVGTLAYPAHTIPDLDIVSSVEEYIGHIKALPEKFQPVSVSLHYHDINKGVHQIFIKHGIPVYTAGNPHDYRFTERFYEILRNFKYATSNHPGSYIFYAVEMNVPFFLFGNPPEFKIKSNTHVAEEAFAHANKKDNFTNHIIKMFGTLNEKITLEQRQFVEYTLGLQDGISRLRMAQILYLNFSKFYLKNKIVLMKRRISEMKIQILSILKL